MKKARKLGVPNLYTDGGEESNEAKILLAHFDIEFVEFVKGVDFTPENSWTEFPTLQAGEGDYSGIDGVKTYIERVKNLPGNGLK